VNQAFPPYTPMKLSVFTDEISRDTSRAIELASAWQIPSVEVRSLDTGRFPLVPDQELEDFQRRLEDRELQVSGVSPGFFKGPVTDPDVPRALAEDLPRACEWAQRWGTQRVSCFAFGRDRGTVPAEVVDRLGDMARIVEAHGCLLILENEAVCWGNTGVEASELIRRVGHDNLSLCWDPGNSARAGSTCPFPEEYEQLRDLVTHVHLKNFDPEGGQWSLMDTGVVDWPGQLAALRNDGYEGFVVIETHSKISLDGFEILPDDDLLHLDPLETNTLRNLQFVRALVPALRGDR